MFNSEAPNLKQETILKALALGSLGVVVLDPNNRVEWMSQDALKLFGIKLRDSYNPIYWENLIQIDGQSVWANELEEMYHEQGFLQVEGYCDSPSRGRIALDLAMQKDPVSLQRFVLIRNITDAKDREEELEAEKQNAQQLNLALETEIQKANELAVMAERANIAKSVFLTSMSHEFRTPLNGVLGYAQMLSREKDLNEKNKKAVKTIEKCGRHLLSIINDVLDLSKVESGKVEVSKVTVDVSKLVIDVVDVFKVRAQNKGLDLVCHLDDQLSAHHTFKLDEKLIRQVMINLIGNAIKFTESGEITVGVVINDFSEDRAKVKFSVADTGAGIDRVDLKQIFEEFYQTEAFSGHKGGTGLGLAISQKLIKALGSEIRVESEVGKGSCFQFEVECQVAENTEDNDTSSGEVPVYTCSDSSVEYLQTYDGNANESVFIELFESLGIAVSVEEKSVAALAEYVEDAKSTVFIGLMLSDVLSKETEAYTKLLKRKYKHVFWILYVDSNTTDSIELIEEFKGFPNLLVSRVPVDVRNLLNELYLKNEDLWIVDESEDEITPTRQRELSNSVPDLQTIKHLQFDAQIGDMRAFSQRLKEWEGNLGECTKFGLHSTKLVDSFKIDELCRYLETTATQVDSSSF